MINRMAQLFATVIGVAIIIGSVYVALTATNHELYFGCIHLPSLVMVLGTLVGYILSSSQITAIAQIAKKLIFDSPAKLDAEMMTVSSQLKNLSNDYYERGPLALRQFIENKELPNVWAKVLMHMEAKVPGSDLRILLNHDAQRFDTEFNSLVGFLHSLVSVAPSVGMLGTVMGLVQLLAKIQDLAQLTTHMSLALLSTLYGIFFGVVFFSPLTARLQAIKDKYQQAFNQAFFWVFIIENHKPASYCEADFMSQMKEGKV